MSSLPDDLRQRGWKLIVRAEGRMFATSISWGCTRTCSNIDEVVSIARDMARWCEAMNRKKAERDTTRDDTAARA